MICLEIIPLGSGEAGPASGFHVLKLSDLMLQFVIDLSLVNLMCKCFPYDIMRVET